MSNALFNQNLYICNVRSLVRLWGHDLLSQLEALAGVLFESWGDHHEGGFECRRLVLEHYFNWDLSSKEPSTVLSKVLLCKSKDLELGNVLEESIREFL